MTGITLQEGQAELPTTRSTPSYWHREPSRRLLGHRTTARVPAEADVVVVGSGITGAFAARRLAEAGRAVLMLEAREACWGATGRNGGHCQPGVWTNKPDVARFELATFHQLASLIADNDIACDWQVVGGVHALSSPAELDVARRQLRRLQKHGDLRDKAVLVERAAALAKLRIPEAVGAVYQPVAAKCWPYKLVAWVLETLLGEHGAGGRFNLQTSTPVLHLQRPSSSSSSSSSSSWILHTPRGQVAARHVVLATNAYTSHLVPRMTGLIVPVRGQVCALEPPRGAVLLPHNYTWVAGGTDDYLIQRDGDDKALILGGERSTVAGGQEGISRDDEVDPVVGLNLRRALGSALKLRPGSAEEAPELEATHEWTGIMGYSRDRHPWVGAEEAAGGLWISAGYTGHGMPVAARCGVAVADMILGGRGGVAVPDEFVVSVQRAARARLMELPRTMMDGLELLEE
ncbi:FAD dependent oxidoreductase domain-containing protein [Hirsutella rhossiliensis]|uniref:FAD dependent oxidoreductase domain-containing protein n=1 Tax=Hirsutella rhossiliensis TaxID=111463 RepID=A0A9P8SF35_9HYPO|nr:FAD dependent oxidoreductase domain-containing protein [Hirsutella rhossiliensis]KAH0959659.1 FAD dependent oxidoreductase domain-containing protein [Hirsutella rhossiliensis]